jgi:hypothetical protein
MKCFTRKPICAKRNKRDLCVAKPAFMHAKKAASSIIFLIVQIALIISGLVFIGLLVSKTTSYTGEVTGGQENVISEASSASLNYIVGKKAGDGKIETLIMRVETPSDGINLEDSLIIINVGNVSAKLKYRNGTLVQDVEEGYYTR